MSIIFAVYKYFESINVETELVFPQTDRLAHFQCYLEDSKFPRVFPSSNLLDLPDACLQKMSRLLLPDSVQPIAPFEFVFGTEAHQAEVDRLSQMLTDQGICSQLDKTTIQELKLANLVRQLSFHQQNMINKKKENSAKQGIDFTVAAIQDTIPAIETQLNDIQAIKTLLNDVSTRQVTCAEKQSDFAEMIKSVCEMEDSLVACLQSLQIDAKSVHSIYSSRASTQLWEQFFNTIRDDNQYFDEIAFKEVGIGVSQIWNQFCTKLLEYDRDVRVYNQNQTEPYYLPFKKLFSIRNPRFPSESECQAFMNVVFEILCELLPGRTVDWRDTSTSTFAPSNPLRKFDTSFVRKGSVSSNQNCVVDWNDVVWFAHYKKEFSATLVNAGLIQVMDGVSELIFKQTYFDSNQYAFGREAGIALLSDGFEVQFVHFGPENDTMIMKRSKRMLAFPAKTFSAQDPVPSGFSFLVRFLMNDPRSLHYVDHGARNLVGDFASSDIDSTVRAHRIVHKGKPDVFFVTPVDQSEAPFVVKRYSNPYQYGRELKIYQLDGFTAQQKRHFPELLSSHESSLTIAIRPLAQSSIFDFQNKFSIELMKEVIRAGLQVLPLLHGRKLIHGDLSAGNILVCDCNADGQHRVVINDFSHTLRLGFPVSQYFGTVTYSSLRMDNVALLKKGFKYGSIDDWQSFAIVLLEFCLCRTSRSSTDCDKRLPWASSHLPTPDALAQKKLYLTNSHMLGNLLSASTSCLDQTGLQFMKEFIATLFQSTDIEDHSRRVADAILLLSSFVQQNPSEAAITLSQTVYVLTTGKRFHTRSVCQGIIFQPIAFAEIKHRTKCPRCAQMDAKLQVDSASAVASMPEPEAQLDPATGLYFETDDI